MGSLDDAIREHLELKRRHGASDDEVKRQEEEAFGRGRRPAAEPEPAGDPIPQDELEAAEPQSNGQPDGHAGPEAPPALEPEAALEPEPALGPEGLDEPDLFEPDEVPADEALEPGLTVSDVREPPAAPPEDVAEPEPAPGADPLEETPEFLEESEEDRLWFEQRPPKDFDF
jgi:hypothetical protein